MAEKRVGKVGDFLGLSVRILAATAIVMILFGIYVGILLFGENSLSVLNHLKQEKKDLMAEAEQLKSENQKLQKEYFELKQLQGVEE